MNSEGVPMLKRTVRQSLMGSSLFICGVSALVLGFQNCSGKPMTSATYGSAASNSNIPCTDNCTATLPGVTADRFQAGEAYSLNKIPFTLKGDLVTDALNYASFPGFKAMAISANGFGYVARNFSTAAGPSQIMTDQEASRMALEVCQVIAGDQPCSIFAEGNLIKYKESDFNAAMAKPLQSGARQFSAAKVPWTSDQIRLARLPAYAADPNALRVLALDLSGGVSYRTGTVSQAENIRMAREQCEGYSFGRPCTVYALANDVQFNVAGVNFNMTPALDFTRTVFLNTAVPFVTDAYRANLAAYPAYADANAGATLAIHPNGAYAYDVNAATTLASCKSLANAGTDCVVYATGKTVVFKRGDLQRAF